MTGKVIRFIITKKDSDHFHKLLKLQNKSVHELNHYISVENSKLEWIPRLKTEFVIIDYPTEKNDNGLNIDILQVLENRGDIYEVSKMGPPETPDLRVLMDCWSECTISDHLLKKDQIKYSLEENLSQDFYLENRRSGDFVSLESEFNLHEIESLLVDEITTLESDKPRKFIIGVKQKGGNWQPLNFNPVFQSVRLRIIG